jgi:ubiquinone/menaquinone biosynthesis C-methylase UbiE
MFPTSVFPPNSSTYIIDAANRLEYVRLADLDQLFTAETGGLFPEQANPNLPGVKRILDVACGTGSWVLNVAFAYPRIEVVGIDVDQDMVEYARTRAQVQRLDDMASFRVMDIRQPLNFPDHHFDLVNARFLAGVLDPASWASLVTECVRIAIPGGIIRLTEVECWSSSSVPLQRLFALLAQALHETGRSCSPDGRTCGIAPLLPQMLRAAGVEDVLLQPFVLDGSARAPRHVGWCENLHSAFYLLKPFLVETARLITADEYDCLLNEAELAMYGSDFCALAFGLTAWGTTPLASLQWAG